MKRSARSPLPIQSANDSGRVSRHRAVGWYAARNDRAGSDNATWPDGDTRQDRRTSTYPGTVTDLHRLEIVGSAALLHFADVMRSSEDHDLHPEVNASTDVY